MNRTGLYKKIGPLFLIVSILFTFQPAQASTNISAPIELAANVFDSIAHFFSTLFGKSSTETPSPTPKTVTPVQPSTPTPVVQPKVPTLPAITSPAPVQ